VGTGLNSAFLTREVLESLGFARLGEDVLVHSTVVIVDCSKVSLGSRVRIDPYVIISTREGVTFGNNVHVGGHSVFAGQAAVEVGDFANISHYVGIYTSTTDLSGRTFSNPTVPGGDKAAHIASIHLGRHSVVGAGTLILPGAALGDGTVVGAVSRVSRTLKPWTIYAGIPARRLRARERGLLKFEREYLATLKTSAAP
jgi:acetyltransferase-like isoleucine patch superfamily enzyme